MKILVKVQEKKSIEKKLNENFSKSSSKKIYQKRGKESLSKILLRKWIKNQKVR